jgi:2-polyprenyl-3-methyl-5-hydroxy-6-metoxy-1,4-benzoquinol methylase
MVSRCAVAAWGILSELHDLWEGIPEGLVPADFPRRLDFLLSHVSAGERVLDVGCGEGHFATALADAGAQVVALDVAEEPLRRARARRADLDVRLVEPEGPWPFEDSSFDVVWAGEVIEHVAATAAWLSEVRRVLRSGGSLLASTPAHDRLTLLRLALSRHAFAAHFEPRSDHLRFYSRSTLTGLLADFGFEQIEVRGSGGTPGARTTLLACARRMRY